MKNFLVSVLVRAGGDCSLDGITSKNTSLKICWNDEDIFELPEDFGDSDLVVKADKICGGMVTIRAFVIDKETKTVKEGGMAGGNFIYSSDSRFPKLGDFSNPISVHDRFEPQWLSDILSR